MKCPKLKLLCAITILLITNITTASTEAYGDHLVDKVVRVYDADTFWVDIDGWPDLIGKNIAIRVNGIDAPEIRGKCPEEKLAALKAKQYVVDYLKGAKIIELSNMRRGKYFRILADVVVDGNNLAEGLIADGHAIRYDGGTKVGWCSKINN